MNEQEKALLLTVARILKLHLSDHVNDNYRYIGDDFKSLREALKPFESNIADINPNKEKT